jgi:hypothetical protein
MKGFFTTIGKRLILITYGYFGFQIHRFCQGSILVDCSLLAWPMPEWMEQRQWRFCGSGNQPWHYCLSMFGKGRTRRAVTSATDKRPEKWKYCPWSTCLQVLLQGLGF